ncbi:DUF4102 domain-containing protein [Allopusillimonas ginsengisoli]|nr:DUF4102 domain-containing protein [Allopusillimonas ginsengisoli]
MQFDARAAKLLLPKQHITIDGHPGLRLEASMTRRTWTYRYRSPIDDRMRQVKIGYWPSMSLPAAIVAWEELRKQRDSGVDVASEKRTARAEVIKKAEEKKTVLKGDVRTVRQVCTYYYEGHIKQNRNIKGQKEIKRTFDTMIGAIGNEVAAELTRSQAFDLIKSYADIPVQAGILRRELGAAWDYCLDAGKLPETAPNWWRLILRGKLKSKGRTIKGKQLGVVKRTLSPDEAGQLIRWLPNFSPVVADILTLYLWTASRGAEIVVMEGREIIEESSGLWWTIPKRKTKNAKRDDATDHRVPLLGRAAVIVRRRKEAYGDGYLFPSYSELGHVEQKIASVAVWNHQPYCESRPEYERPRLTVTHWAPHDLRRTSRTFLASLGCPGDVGEVIIGHMLEGDKGTYDRHTYDKERQIWIKRLSTYLEKLAVRR